MPQLSKSKQEFSPQTIKTQVLNTLQTLNLSDLINMKIGGQLSGFTSERIKTNIHDGKISGFRVHRIRHDVKLIDKDLQSAIDRMYNSYNLYVLNIYSDLSKLVNSQFAKRVIRQYFLYGDRDRIRKNINLSDAVYLLEFEVTKEDKTHIGDKLSSRFASKGIVSLILPDELRPYCQESGEPIDFIYNPFGGKRQIKNKKTLKKDLFI